MRLWPIMVTINEREGVSVTSLRDRLALLGFFPSRRVVRHALKRLVRYGILDTRANTSSGRALWWRKRRP